MSNAPPRKALLVASLAGLAASLVLGSVLWAARTRAAARASVASYTPASGAATWEGEWEFSELGADPSEAGAIAGTDRVTLPFTGTQLALSVRRGNYRGYLYVSVDGRPANLLPRDERGAYLVLTSADYTTEVVTLPVAARLADGPHRALVSVERGWDQWPLVGWTVSRGPDTSRYPQALAAALLLGCASLVGVAWALHHQETEGTDGTSRTPWPLCLRGESMLSP